MRSAGMNWRWLVLSLVACSLPGSLVGADDHGRPSGRPDTVLYVWASDQARVAPDFLAVVNFDEDSAGYGRVIIDGPDPASGQRRERSAPLPPLRRQANPRLRRAPQRAQGAERHLEMEEKILKKYEGVIYKSMDIDRSVPHDYYSLDEIDEQFDLIILFDVIEHLELEQGVELLSRLYELLVDGGS